MIILCILSIIAFFILLGLYHAGADWGGWYVNWIDGLSRLLCRYWHRLAPTKITLPETGGAIVVANHVSGLDPFLLIAASQRPLRFLIAREQYERFGLKWLFRMAGCIPVDRSGRPEKAFRAAQRALEQGEVIALFPHGTIHLDSDPYRPIKKGFAKLALLADVPVFPVRIDGVRAQGHVILAPWIPSHVQLTLYPALCLNDAAIQNSVVEIEAALSCKK